MKDVLTASDTKHIGNTFYGVITLGNKDDRMGRRAANFKKMDVLTVFHRFKYSHCFFLFLAKRAEEKSYKWTGVTVL